VSEFNKKIIKRKYTEIQTDPTITEYICKRSMTINIQNILKVLDSISKYPKGFVDSVEKRL
jgi:hypothetical protein